MEIIVDHAGADHGVLMIREKDGKVKDVYSQLCVKAIWESDKNDGSDASIKTKRNGKVIVNSTKVLLNNSFIPGNLFFLYFFLAFFFIVINNNFCTESLVSFVAHSRRMMVLNDIQGSDFAYDEYPTF